MPLYDYECPTCGVVEVFKGMNDPAPARCPQCKSTTFDRVFSTQTAFIAPCDSGWETENDGLGKWMPQLGARYLDPHTRTTKNPAAYARSRADAIDAFKRKGYDDIQKY